MHRYDENGEETRKRYIDNFYKLSSIDCSFEPVTIVDGFRPRNGKTIDFFWSKCEHCSKYLLPLSLSLSLSLPYIIMNDFPTRIKVVGRH
jgi:hypothetical protein